MTETQYNIIKAGEPKAPPISLIKISGERNLIVSLDVFGPTYFEENIKEMQKSYFHPQTGETITFREPTTTESVLIASYDFENRAKPRIFDPKWLQIGRIVRTSEGVFANPPKDTQRNTIIDEKILKSYLNKVKPVKVGKGKIYIVSDTENLKDFGFIEYDSFKRGVQDCDEFVNGGLARILEHSEESKNLKSISSPKFYKRGVNVWNFDKVKQPVLKVVSLDSDRNLDGGRLDVDDDGRCDYYVGGFAFGVLDDKMGENKNDI